MPRAIIVTMFLSYVRLAGANTWFADDFDDAELSALEWQFLTTGDIEQADGVLHITRTSRAGFLRPIQSFSGDFRIELDVRPDRVTPDDSLFGFSIRDTRGLGASFGFADVSRMYLGEHKLGSVGNRLESVFEYGPPNGYHPGVWQHWTLIKQNGVLTPYVNGELVPISISNSNQPGTLGGFVPDNVTIEFPGVWSDKDGPTITTGESRITIDNFLVSSAIPEPTTPLALTWFVFRILSSRQHGRRFERFH